jgi:hypothetical protein
MVKDSTKPSLSLDTKVKYSSLAILHQIYSVTGGFYIIYRYRREQVHNCKGFPTEGHTILRGVAQSRKRRKILGKGASGYSWMA